MLAAISLALLAGCAQDQVSSITMEQATQPLTCMSRAECDAWWARAQVWVTNHTEYKIETITNSVIQTAGPSSGKRALAYQVTLTPTNEATATIGFAAHCDSPLGCNPNPWAAGADFKQFVRNGPSTARYVTPQATVPAPPADPEGVQVNPIPETQIQPQPLNLEIQPGQSNRPLTPQ
jgi:hypothetical protein